MLPIIKSVGSALYNTFTRGMSSTSSYTKVTHVIFDLDGVLIDSETVYEKSFAVVIESFGKKYLQETRLAALGTKEQDTARIIVEQLDLPISPEEFSKKCKQEMEKFIGNIPLKPGAQRLVEHLHGHKVPIAVATSSGEKSFLAKVHRHKDLFDKFSHVVTGSSDPEVVNGKPAPDIFLICARRFSNPPTPKDCIVFEDSPNGVRGAIDAGMQCVMVPEDYLPRDRTKDATFVISSLLDFKPEQFGLPPFPS